MEEYNNYINKKKTVRFKWSQPCPGESKSCEGGEHQSRSCNGFLNDKYECPICENKYCKDCLVIFPKVKPLDEEGKVIEHVCNEELKETVKMIRKESKPCPSCGEFISKISGCDQMFCTSCGTAFSWKTGQKELGVIHNPHAHQFFQNNPEAYNNYMAERNNAASLRNGNNNNNNNNQCRPLLPTVFNSMSLTNKLLMNISKTLVDKNDIDININMVLDRITQLDIIHRNLSEYHQYYYTRAEEKLMEEENNMDLRLKLIHKDIDEQKFKSVLHMRNKKIQFKKLIHELISSTIIIWGGLLWNIINTNDHNDFIKIYDMMHDVRNTTNDVIDVLKDKHNYKEKIVINEQFSIPRYLAGLEKNRITQYNFDHHFF